MDFFIVGLLVLVLLGDLVICRMQKLLSEIAANIASANTYLLELRRDLSRLETLQKKTPETIADDDEAKYSRAIEEGIANLMQYQVGKEKEP